MEKKEYRKPLMYVEQFVPNEYIAGCWIVHCNVRTGHGWVDSNDNGKPDAGELCCSPNSNQYSAGQDGYYGTYTRNTTWSNISGCNEEHIGVSIGNLGPQANAKWQNVNWAGGNSGEPFDVYYWCDDRGGHATIISSAEWQTNPNAS